MWNLIELEASKSYATRENAIKAVTRKYPDIENTRLRFFIYTLPNGRFIPVFIGESAMQAGVHFNFHVVA